MNRKIAVPTLVMLVVIALVLASVPSQSVLVGKRYGICGIRIKGEKGSFFRFLGKVKIVKVNETVTIKVFVRHLPYILEEWRLSKEGVNEETIRVTLYVDGEKVEKSHTYKYLSGKERWFSIEFKKNWTKPGTYTIRAEAELLQGGSDRFRFSSEVSKTVRVINEERAPLLAWLRQILPLSIVGAP